MLDSGQDADPKGLSLDAEALRRLREGDRALFDTVVRNTHPAVQRLAMRIVRHAADAQEVTQETYLAAFQRISSFDGRAAVKSWLLTICYRKAIDLLRARKTAPWLIEGELEDSPLWPKVKIVEQFTDWAQNPEHHYGRQEFRALLERMLLDLPAQSRAVFELRDIQGMTTREVAEVLEMSEGAVRVRLHRVRQYLTSELETLLGRGGAKQ